MSSCGVGRAGLALNALAAPPALTRAVTDQLSQEAAVIPINELGTGLVTQEYVEAGFNERGSAIYFNTQNFWLNK